jgi:hypothetical protein
MKDDSMTNNPALSERQDALLAQHAVEQAQLARVESLARTMDAAFMIPGTKIPLGVDTIVGLVPGIGDTVSLGIAAYIASHGIGLKAKKHHMLRMGWNIFLDWLIGLVPVIGDILDIGWRGNLRNAALLRQITEDRWVKERAEVGIIDHF